MRCEALAHLASYGLQGLVPERGYLCGVMEASNVPNARAPIITFWCALYNLPSVQHV